MLRAACFCINGLSKRHISAYKALRYEKADHKATCQPISGLSVHKYLTVSAYTSLFSFGRPFRGKSAIRSHTTIRPTTTAAIPTIRCRCGSTFPCLPVFKVLYGGFPVMPDSTTAAFPVILCRCGRAFSCDSVFTVLQGGFMVRLYPQRQQTVGIVAIVDRAGRQ